MVKHAQNTKKVASGSRWGARALRGWLALPFWRRAPSISRPLEAL